MLQDGKNIAEEMNFFKNAVLTLDINENCYIINHNIPFITDPIEKAIEKYKFHPSILLKKEKKTKCKANYQIFNKRTNQPWETKTIAEMLIAEAISQR